MDEAIYQDVKATLEKLAAKVPGTWETLVREVMARNAAQALLALIGVVVGGVILRRIARKFDLDDPAHFFGALILVATTIMCAGAVVDGVMGAVSPNIATAKMLLGK